MPKNYRQTTLKFSSSQPESGSSSGSSNTEAQVGQSRKRKLSEEGVSQLSDNIGMASQSSSNKSRTYAGAVATGSRPDIVKEERKGPATERQPKMKRTENNSPDQVPEKKVAGRNERRTENYSSDQVPEKKVAGRNESLSASSLSARPVRADSDRDKDLKSSDTETDGGGPDMRLHQGMEKPEARAFDDGEDSNNSDDGGTEDYYRSKQNVEDDKPDPSTKISKGSVRLDELKTAPKCYKVPLPELKPSKQHKILFRTPTPGNIWREDIMSPYPVTYTEVDVNHKSEWDSGFHVCMPCSVKNVIPSQNGPTTTSRWKEIEKALEAEITDVFTLEEAILSYNRHYRKKWKFEALHDFFCDHDASDTYRDNFFTNILPKMQKLALDLPNICTRPIPFLKADRDTDLTMSQQQAACLLANAFFCTFPKRNFRIRGSNLPDINFSHLYSADERVYRKKEKFKCIINYFERVTNKMPTGTLTFSRRHLVENSLEFVYKDGCEFPCHELNQMKLNSTELYVSTVGTIEDDGEGMLQADFANKYVGGGVLGHGLVQEEIRFMLCPEMILSRLFTEVLGDKEVLIMKGCERFNSYTGYSNSFKWKGDYTDTTPKDAWGRRSTEVVAMDALVIKHYRSQFERYNVMRELIKAYVAFKRYTLQKPLPAVCTGNWGCGAFGGDKQLKALIQLMAACMAGRDVCYFTFGDEDFCNQLAGVHKILKGDSLKIGRALTFIEDFKNDVLYKKTSSYNYNQEKQTLFEYIAVQCTGCVPSEIKSRNTWSGQKSPNYKAETP